MSGMQKLRDGVPVDWSWLWRACWSLAGNLACVFLMIATLWEYHHGRIQEAILDAVIATWLMHFDRRSSGKGDVHG